MSRCLPRTILAATTSKRPNSPARAQFVDPKTKEDSNTPKNCGPRNLNSSPFQNYTTLKLPTTLTLPNATPSFRPQKVEAFHTSAPNLPNIPTPQRHPNFSGTKVPNIPKLAQLPCPQPDAGLSTPKVKKVPKVRKVRTPEPHSSFWTPKVKKVPKVRKVPAPEDNPSFSTSNLKQIPHVNRHARRSSVGYNLGACPERSRFKLEEGAFLFTG